MHYRTTLYIDDATFSGMGLEDHYSLHQYIYSMFSFTDRASERILFERKPDQPGCKVFEIISSGRPRTYGTAYCETVEFNPEFGMSDRCRFRLHASPSNRDADGRKVNIFRDSEIREWLERKSGQHGFRVISSVNSIRRPVRMTHKGNQNCVFTNVYITGELQVTDPELFNESCITGIGREKAFGFGMLTATAMS